jgi:NADH-quinone oxidoreductase subunit M
MTLHLSILLWLPAAAGLLGLFAGRAARWVTLAGALLALAFSIALIADFDSAAKGLQYVTDETWIAQLGIHYKLGVDGLNLFLLALTTLLFAASVLWSGLDRVERPGQFFFWLGLAETAVLGALLAQDLALFVVFFDLMLIPFFFLTGSWGGPGRVPAVL